MSMVYLFGLIYIFGYCFSLRVFTFRPFLQLLGKDSLRLWIPLSYLTTNITVSVWNIIVVSMKPSCLCQMHFVPMMCLDDKATVSARVCLVLKIKTHINCIKMKICGKSCKYNAAAIYQNLFKIF
jgi:hypothetical protein